MANQLFNEKSPYLLQHAENPVNWHPWADQAFHKAKEENKPIFLSIGYSTCHWCHVMAHESFEDEEIAQILNESFVSIKVDREERPEVDAVYMSVCQDLTGQGGWPLTIIMTPDKKPFFAGTYFPKKSRYGMTGLLDILHKTAKLWKSDQSMLLKRSESILTALKSADQEGHTTEPSWNLVKQGFEELLAMFDSRFGGFGSAPKFPVPHNLLFLLQFYEKTGNKKALSMAEATLFSMARGGIHDHIGGGFSRYSTDARWLVPHFEKMLYDNALLALAYLEGFRITGHNEYRHIAERILTYVDRELTAREGGFYCGQDADSEGVEGKYYVFSKEELGNLLEQEELALFCQQFNITERGNFEGKNIPNLNHDSRSDETDSLLNHAIQKVYKYRLKRTILSTDDKILTSWNSMMIMAYGKAGFFLDNDHYKEKAIRAQEFMKRNLIDQHGRLLVRYRNGESAFPGNLDDYAYYSLALLTLYEVTLEIKYLEQAIDKAKQMVDLFWDQKQGGFYFYGNDVQELIQRPKETYDGAIPSGNSAAAHVLLMLGNLTANEVWLELSHRQLSFLAADADNGPSSHCFSLLAFIKALGEEKELICVSAENEVPGELLSFQKDQRASSVSILFKCPANQQSLSQIAPFTREYKIPAKGVCYYLCENHTCSLPFTSLSEVIPPGKRGGR